MSRISDSIEDFLKLLLEESGGKLEIQRNELADYFECAPSQINYVLATRFSLERGYYIESRRGGGGYIRIVYLDMDDDDYLYRLITGQIGNKLSQNQGENIVDSLVDRQIITSRESAIIKSGLKNKAIGIPASIRDDIRANILKDMLTAILAFYE